MKKNDPSDDVVHYEVNGTKVMIFPPLPDDEKESDTLSQAYGSFRKSGKGGCIASRKKDKEKGFQE